MAIRIPARLLLAVTSVGAALSSASPASAAKARLVHCAAADTCLRLSGRRAHRAVAVQVAGHDLQVAGARRWRVDVPLAAARRWRGIVGDKLAMTLADPETGGRSQEIVLLPPGALAGRVELAELLIRAH